MTTIATKTARTFQTSVSNSAADTTTGTGVNLTTALGCTITAKITNGATGPTIGCNFRIDISVDNSNWKQYVLYDGSANTVNNGVYELAYDLPAPVMYARTVFTGNTAEAVTVEAFGHELTSMG